MTVLGYLLWAVIIGITLIPVIGLIAEFCDWHKDKSIKDYERGEYGKGK